MARLDLVPFDGEDAAIRLAAGVSGRALRKFAFDRSGTKRYTFSRLGYRSEELDLAARRRVFVCGASVAFGSGLDVEETWPARFRDGYALEHDLAPDEVNLLNFSAPLAPPDYVVRTLLLQASRVRPDVMIAQFSSFKRIEVVRGARFTGIGVPLELRVHARDLASLRRRPRATLAGAHDHFLKFLRSALLLQYFCEARSIDLLLLWDRRPHEPYTALFDAPAFAPLVALLDRDALWPCSVFDRDIFVDRSADGIHPGPRSSEIIAGRLLAQYRQRRRVLRRAS